MRVLLGTAVAASQPFIQSTAGAITLGLLTVLCSGMVTWFLRYQSDVRSQNRILFRLSDAIMPEGRAGLVERMERVEVNLSVCAEEVERNQALASENRRELLASFAELRVWCENELRNRAA